MKDNDHSYYNVQLLSETEKAYLIQKVGASEELWIPKSLCEYKPGTSDPFNGVIEVESWFAKNCYLDD